MRIEVFGKIHFFLFFILFFFFFLGGGGWGVGNGVGSGWM